MFAKIRNTLLSIVIALGTIGPTYAAPMTQIDGNSGQFFFRYKNGQAVASAPDDTQTKAITAFLVGGVDKPFSEKLPIKADWQDDAWRVLSGSLPPGLDFDPLTLTFHGTPTTVGMNTVVELEGIDVNGNSVGKATVSFDIHEILGIPVPITVYAHTGKYKLYELPIPKGLAIDSWTKSSVPKGVTVNGPYFEGTPTEVGYTPIYIEGKDLSGAVVATFWGKYIVEDGPSFAFIPDDIKDLGTYPNTAIGFTERPPAINYAIDDASKVQYFVEIAPGEKLPGSVRSNGLKTTSLFLAGFVSNPYETVKVRWTAIDTDGVPGQSNWFTFGSANPTPECVSAPGHAAINFLTGTAYDFKLNSVYKVPGAISYTLLSGTPPKGITFDQSTGHLIGKPTETAPDRLVSVRIDVTNGTNVVSATCDYMMAIISGSLKLTDDTAEQARYVRTGDIYQGLLTVKGGIPTYGVKFDDPASAPGFSFSTPSTDTAAVGVTGKVETKGTISIPFTVDNNDGNSAHEIATIYGRGALAIDNVADFAVQRLEATQVWTSAGFDPLNIIPDVTNYPPSVQPSFTLNQLGSKPLPEGLVFDKNFGRFIGVGTAPEDVYGPFSITIHDFSGDAKDSNPFSITMTKREPLDLTKPVAPEFIVERTAPQSKKVVGQIQPFGARNFPIAWTLNGPAPSWLSINPDTGELGVAAGVPYEDIKSYGPFTITADDGEMTKTSKEFDVTISDVPAASGKPVAPFKNNVTGNTAKGETATFFGLADLKQYIDENTIIGTVDETTILSTEPASPAGLSFSPSGRGSLTGPPTSEYSGDVTVNFQDKKGRTGKITVPLQILPYPVAFMEQTAFDVPRLSVSNAVTGKQGVGFWNAAQWFNVGNMPTGLSVEQKSGKLVGTPTDAIDTVVTGMKLKAISLGGDGVTELTSFTDPFSVKIVTPVTMGLAYKPEKLQVNLQPIDGQPGKYSFVSTPSIPVPGPTGSYVAPLTYTLDRSQADIDGMTGTLGINATTGRFTGNTDVLGDWTVYVNMTDAELNSIPAPVGVPVHSTLNGDVEGDGGGIFTMRQSEPFKTDPIVVSNYVGSVVFSTSPALLPDQVAFNSLTGAFTDASIIDTAKTTSIQVQAKDSHDRKMAAPVNFVFKTIAPLKVAIQPSKAAIATKQYSAASDDKVDVAFGPTVTNQIGEISYGLTGTLPGTTVLKSPDPTSGDTTYSWTDGADKRHVLTVNGAGQQTIHTANGVNAPVASSVEDTLPVDALVFDTKSATLAGIPSQSGVFTFKVSAYDDHAEQYIRNVATRIDYNSATSQDVTMTVSPADPLFVTNEVAGAPGSEDTIYRYTTTSTLKTVLGNAAYGRGIAAFQKTAGSLPAGVTASIGTGDLTYRNYPTEQGTFAGIAYKLTDYAGRDIGTDPVTINVGPRQPLQLVTASNPAGLVVNQAGSVTVTAKNAAYGQAIKAGDWTVTGVANLPDGMTYAIANGAVTFSGTPTIIKDYGPIVIGATDAVGDTASMTLTIKVISPTDAIVLNVTPITTKIGYPFSMQATATNTYGTVRFYSSAIDSQYASNLDLNTATGLITGSFSSPVVTNFDLNVTDDTNRLTKRPISVTAVPNLRVTVPTNVAATQGEALNRTIDTLYAVGTVTYEKGSGSWPDGLGVNSSTGEIIGYDMSSGTFVNMVLPAPGAYPGLTVKGTDEFTIQGTTYKDIQESNAFTVTVAPTTAIPDIANPTKTILGTQGSQIVSWKPSTVIKSTTKKWVFGGTVYSTNYDLTQYGLTFDKNTGTISGTPMTPFIIRDFVMTVTSSLGASDSTTPFWIGVAPQAAIAVSPTQPASYLFRLSKAFETDPIVVLNTIGTVTMSKPSATTLSWNSTTGVWSYGATGHSTSWVNSPTTLTTTISDEFGRTGSFSFVKDFVPALTLKYTSTPFVSNNPVKSAVPTVTGQQGNLSYALQGAPAYVSVNVDTGEVTATLPNGTAQSFTVVVTDNWDGATATASAAYAVMTPNIADIPNKKLLLGTEGGSVSFAPTVTQPDGSPWTFANTVYSLNYDISQYGLTFDTTTGAISGTASSGFIIPDAVITVTSADGKTDKTTAFWMGVAPLTQMSIDPQQKSVYYVRINKAFTSDPINVINAVGTLKFANTTNNILTFDTALGTYYSTAYQMSGWAGITINNNMTATDEFGRSIPWSQTLYFRGVFGFVYGNKSLRMGVVSAFAKAVPTADTAFGNVTWSAIGLPAPLTMDSSGAITGTVPIGSYASGTVFPITMTAVDDGDPTAGGTVTKVWNLTLN
jgi:hypothetical protein